MDGWEQIELLCACRSSETASSSVCPLVLFGDSVAEQAEEISAAERTLYRMASGFEVEAMESLLGAPAAGRKRLPPRSGA